MGIVYKFHICKNSVLKRLELIIFLLRIKSNELGLSQKFVSGKQNCKKLLKLIFGNSILVRRRKKSSSEVFMSQKQYSDFTESRSLKNKSIASIVKRDCIMFETPIIFIHRNYSDYLNYSLRQAKESNPESQIYLIGDESNDCYDFVSHHSMSDYGQESNEFMRIYKHYSTNSYEFELYCFQRWFVLREFLVMNGIDRCLYLDSDIMLYANIKNEHNKFGHFDFTLSHLFCGCTFFLYRLEALINFCEFLKDIYKKKDKYNLDRMISQFAVRKKNKLPGGACDMTAFGLYQEEHFGEVGEVSQIIDGSVYDPGITISSPGFEMVNGIKKVIWKNDKPYGIYLKTGKEIKFNSLHFQGNTKFLMKDYCVR